MMGRVFSWKRISAKKQMMSTMIDIWLPSRILSTSIAIDRIRITSRHTFSPDSMASTRSSIVIITIKGIIISKQTEDKGSCFLQFQQLLNKSVFAMLLFRGRSSLLNDVVLLLKGRYF